MAKILKMLVCSFFIMVLVSCSTMIQDFGKLQKESDYKLENWFEESDTNEFVLDAESIQLIKLNQIDSISAQDITGFTFYKKEVVNQENNRAVKMFYKRNIVSITYDPNGGGWKAEADMTSKIISGKYGAKVPEYPANEELIRIDYRFVGWSANYDTFPADNVTVTAEWTQINAPYTIRYEIQNVENDEYSLLKEIVSGGEIDNVTSVTAESIEGFEDPVITNTTITEDGTAVVTVKYNRKVFTYRLKLSEDDSVISDCKWADGSSDDVIKTGKYESEYDVSEFVPPVRGEGNNAWGFAGWNEEGGALPSKITCDKTFVAQWAKLYAQYTVITKKEDINNPGTYVVISEETLNGSIGSITNISKEGIEGYVIQEIIQKEILKDDSTVVEVLYNLADVTVTFNINGGHWYDNSTESLIYTGKYGQPINPSYPNNIKPAKEFNVFKGWTPDFTRNSGNEIVYPATDKTYFAVWEKTGAYYGVRHHIQNVTDDNFVLDESKTQTFLGEVGAVTDVHGELYGFEYETIIQKQIAEDDSTVVDIYWKRVIYTITFNPNNGNWTDTGSVANKTIQGKYESTANVPETVTRPDYAFNGWTPEIPDDFKFLEDKTFTASWNLVGTPYTVHYLFEKVSHDGTAADKYESKAEYKDQTNTGSVYIDVDLTPPEVTGFVVSSIEGEDTDGNGITKIKADGTTEITVYYNRKSNINYTFIANGGAWPDGDTTKVISGGIYGHTVNTSSITDPKWMFHIFKKWTPAVDATFGASDKTFTAVWEEIPTTIITGTGIYTAKDSLAVEATVNGNNVTVSATIPYDDTWTFDWVDNGISIDSNGLVITTNANKVSFTKEFTYGYHKLTVYAKDSGGAVESAFVSFRVE